MRADLAREAQAIIQDLSDQIRRLREDVSAIRRQENRTDAILSELLEYIGLDATINENGRARLSQKIADRGTAAIKSLPEEDQLTLPEGQGGPK